MALAFSPLLLVLSFAASEVAAVDGNCASGDGTNSSACQAAYPLRDQVLLQLDHLRLAATGSKKRVRSTTSSSDLGGGRQPEACTFSAVQRRRRQAEMCSCRRRSSTADLPAGYRCGQSSIEPIPPPCSGADCPRVVISGRQLMVDGKPFHMKGINWNPIGWGDREPKDRNIDYASFAERDADLMAAAGINAVRTYGPLKDVAVLDILWSRGIWVLNTAYADGSLAPETAEDVVDAVKDHPAILMWVIGNEWNYNGIYAGLNFLASVEQLNSAAAAIKSRDAKHPVSSIYGGVPSSHTLASMPDVDVWGLNIYSGLTFGGVFSKWWTRSDKPMYFGEYGADAWDANRWRENQEAQAEATIALTNEILAHSSANGGACLGGLLFEFADEWWKDSSGSDEEHDLHGVAPGGGPHPDKTFNEEWWGIVDITRTPRLAYEAYRASPNPGYSGTPAASPASTPPAPASACTANHVQRRRRNVDMCACRRRSGSSDLGGGWTCQGPSIVPEA